MEKTDTESHGYANNVDPQYNFNALLTRAENLARILDVQETFARDSGGRQDWRMVLVINADAEAFYKLHTEAVSANVLRFYITERSNPTSIFAAASASSPAASSLRPVNRLASVVCRSARSSTASVRHRNT